MIEWSNISKRVGWDKRTVEYPTMARVGELHDNMLSCDADALVELLTYHRFLSWPETEEQREISKAIANLIKTGRELIEQGYF